MAKGTKETKQVTNSGPWPDAQDDLNRILNQAKRLNKKDKGFNAYPGEGYVPFSDETNQAFGQIQSIAGQGNPFSAGATNFTKGLIGGDYNLDKSGLASILGNNPNAINLYGSGIASGANGINVNPQLQSLLGRNADALQSNTSGIASGARSIGGALSPQLQALMGQTPSAIGQNAGGIASGADKIGTEGDYRSLFDSVDPGFESVVQNTANDLGDQISRQFGGANYGSAGHSDYLTKQVGDVVGKMRSDNFNQNLANKASILGNITGVQSGNLANRLNASSALSGEQGAALAARAGLIGQMGGLSAQDISNQLAASGAISNEQAGNRAQQSSILGQVGGFQGQNIGNQLNAAGALSNEQQTGFNNTRGIYGDLANLSQQDIQNRLAGLGQMDSVYASQYLPAQMLAGVGAAKEAKAGEKLQADMDRFAIEDMSDWDRLLNYFGIASGTGAQGGTAVQSVQQPSNPWSSILGGGILASQYL